MALIDGGSVVPAASVRKRLNPAVIPLGIAIVVLLVIVGYPLLWLLMSAVGVPDELTFQNLVRAYTRPQNLMPLWNTVVLAFGAGIMSVVLGVPLAWATARTNMPGRWLIRGGVALAYITPPYLTAIAYIILMGPVAGYANRLLRLVIDVPSGSGPLNIFSMTGVIVAVSLHVFAFVYFMTETALRSVDASLEEAARMLGAKQWRVALKINLPLVAPAITGGALLAAIDAMALFGPQAFIGSPAQIIFLPTRIYGVITSYPPRWGEASALSLILVIITCAGLLLQRGYLERRSYITMSGRGIRTAMTELGAWRWPLFLVCATVILFAAIAPVGVLALSAFSKSWVAPIAAENLTFENFRAALVEEQLSVSGIINSFKLAIGAACVAVVLGGAIAYIDVRTNLRGRRVLDYLALLPLGLPGTVMAVGVILAFIRPPLVIYGTIWILLVCYIGRFVPLAARSAGATMRQIDPSLEEAARICGATWFGSIRRILVPLARPGLIVAFLLVFVPAFSELSATVLLYSAGTENIAVAMMRLNDGGKLEVVAALAVFTIAVILVVSLALNWFTGRSQSRLDTSRQKS